MKISLTNQNFSFPSLSKPQHGSTVTIFIRNVVTFIIIIMHMAVHVPAQKQNDNTTTTTTRPPSTTTPPLASQQDPYPLGQRFNPSMAIIMIVLVSAFFLMGFLSVYIRQCTARRFHGSGGSPDNPSTPYAFGRRSLRAARGLDAPVIESFPVFLYSTVKGRKIGKGSLECAVCLNEFEDEDALRFIPKCCHVFHRDCIDAWLSAHSTCPVCRANLVPKPGEEQPQVTVQFPEHGIEPEVNDRQDEVRIPVENNQTEIEELRSPDIGRPQRSKSTGMRFARLFMFPRSHSTGHSLVQPGEDIERFTLRLPEDVRQEIMNATLSRAKSCVEFPRARSSRTGFRTGSVGGRVRGYFNYERFDREDRSDKWTFSVTPPFVTRSGSVRFGRGGVGDELGATPSRSWFKSEKSPFDQLILERNDGDGERSTDRLRQDGHQV